MALLSATQACPAGCRRFKGRRHLESRAVQLGTQGELLGVGEAAQQQQQDSSPLQQALQGVAHQECHERPLHMHFRV